MPRLDRTGQTFGKLTVLEDSQSSDQLLCRCACGREGLYPRSISKPTYKGRHMCAWCAGWPCVICGELIPAKPGHPPATCSTPCATEHIKRRGRDYYERVRDTESWRTTRAEYLQQRAERMANNPIYAARIRRQGVAASRKHRSRINADPVSRAAVLAKKRAYANALLDRLRQDGRYDAYLRKHQLWYASLSKDDYWRIFRVPRLREELRRKRVAISRKIAGLGHTIAGHALYTREEEALIRDRYAEKGPAWLAEQLGRSYQAIIVKACFLRDADRRMVCNRNSQQGDIDDYEHS